jgi:hypothetical protein
VRFFTLTCLISIAVLSGCAHGRSPRTKLTIRAVNSSVGRAVFHLECEPPGGDLPRPERACTALARNPDLVTRPEPFVCPGGRFSWWDITIRGRLDGKQIERSFSTCWTPQMATLGRFGMTWQVLQRHLEGNL